MVFQLLVQYQTQYLQLPEEHLNKNKLREMKNHEFIYFKSRKSFWANYIQ